MINSLLLESGLSNCFWAEAMDTANYLRNRLPTNSQRGEIIPEEAWTQRKQNLGYIRVFGSTVHVGIATEKIAKSDTQKTWKKIFLGYSPDTSKHYRVWAPKAQRVLIADHPTIDKSEQEPKMLQAYPVINSELPPAKRKAPAGETAKELGRRTYHKHRGSRRSIWSIDHSNRPGLGARDVNF